MWARALGRRQGGATRFTALWLCVGGGLGEGTMLCLASGGLLGTCSVSSHFAHSPYATGALPAVALVQNPRVSGFAYVLRQGRPFKWSLLKVWQFLLPPQHPQVFAARSYGDLSSWRWNSGLCGLAWGWDL